MKKLGLVIMMLLTTTVWADCSQNLSQQLRQAPVTKLQDGSTFVSYQCFSGCPVAELVNFCTEVAHATVSASVKAVRLTIDRGGRIVRRGLKTSACFVTNTVGQVRAVSCRLINNGLGMAHNSVLLARNLTRRAIGLPFRVLKKLDSIIFGDVQNNVGTVCGCSVGGNLSQK